MKFETYKFENVTSTNDVAINLIKNEKKESGCVYAETQTNGRGTQGRKWISEIGNLFVSIFFPLKNNYPSINEFSIINPVLISSVLKNICSKEVSLKWPNDIFINSKKICGILQEVVTFGEKKFLIIGIGVNVITNPSNNVKYQSTNIFKETKIIKNTKEIVDFLIFTYENFFLNIKNYNFVNYKTKADLMAINQ